MDGFFPSTVGLLLAQTQGVKNAMIGAGLPLGFKRVAVVVLAPVGGRLADRFGARVATRVGFAVATVGALVIAAGGVIAGAVLLSSARR